MATTLLLIRHAVHDRPGPLLVGRDDDVGLSDRGQRQARRLADRLAPEPIAAVLTSPSRRCRTTAELVAAPHGIAAAVVADLDEIDFGAWRGRSFKDLRGDPAWHRFNTARRSARIPGGETFAAVEARVDRAFRGIRDRFPDRLVAVVSHGDVIRAGICQVLGLSPDLMLRFEVAPGSISTVELGSGAPRLLGLNWRADLRG